MTTIKFLVFAAAAFATFGSATAEPNTIKAPAATVHLAPDGAGAVAGNMPVPVPSSSIAWPVVSGEAAEKAVAAQKAEAVRPVPPPVPTLLINIDLATQRMVVTENGAGKFTWAVSSARAGYRTPTGTFKPTWMSAMWYSRQYDMSPMPHSVFFSGGTAIHATYATGQLGTPASHGCVRLSPKNAKTLYNMVSKHGKERTRITVHGQPKNGSWNVASQKQRNVRRYAAMPYGYAPPGWYSGQYYRPAPSRSYYVPRRAVKRGYRAPGYAYGYGY